MSPLMSLSWASRWVVWVFNNRWNFLSKSSLQPLSSSTPSYSTSIWVALVDVSVNELVLGIKVRDAGGHIDLGASDDNSSTFDDISTDLPPASTSSCSNAIWVALVDESVDELVLNIEVSGATTLLKVWLKLPVEITTVTTTIINSINLMLANWLSSVSATTTNPDYTLPGLCWLGTRGLQHRGKWCSYPAKLGWTAGKIWRIQGRPGCLVLTLVQVRASGWTRPTLEANRFLMARLLKSQTHSQKDPPDFRSKKMGKDGSTYGWLGWSDEPIG